MEADTAPRDDQWRLGPGPFLFSGVPPMCMGSVDLINDSDEKIRIRRIPVVGYEHEDDAVRRLGLSELRVAALLAPQHRTRARAFFRLDPSTPPGTYEASLSRGEQSERIVVHVWEKHGVRVDPGEIRLRGAADQVVRTSVVATNEGNVTETLRDVALVFLEERDWVGRSAVVAMRDTKDEEGHTAYLDRVLHELKNSLVRPMRINLHFETPNLEPGETRQIALELTLPSELRKGRTYFGSTKFASTKLIFKVDCNGAGGSTRSAQ
jgi:hypothetical protein